MRSDSASNIKNRFGSYMSLVKQGEVVLVLEHGKPVAQISKPTASKPNTDLSIKKLEAEGALSAPITNPINATNFLSTRVPIKGISATQALLKDRDESQ